MSEENENALKNLVSQMERNGEFVSDKNLKQAAGTLIVIMGSKPRGRNGIEPEKVLSAVANASMEGLDNVEMVVVENTPVFTMANLEKIFKKNGKLTVDALDVNHEDFSTPLARAYSSLEMAAGEIEERRFEEREKNRLAAMTPEQIEAENVTRREESKKLMREAHENSTKRRQDQMREAFEIADKWASREDLSKEEACHGVAREFYIKHAEPTEPHPETGRSRNVNSSKEYDVYFDTRLKDRIQQSNIRAAKALFGKK